MHELSITQNMLDLVLKHAEQAGANKVTRINLVIGEMTGVVDECVQLYFKFLGKGTIAEDAVLSFTTSPMKVRCQDCGKSFELKGSDTSCPSCHGKSLEIISGKELFVESIEVN